MTFIKQLPCKYSETRWKDSYAIVDLSLYNYMEMSTHVNSRIFLLRKYLDNILHAFLPRTFIPLYTMVAFTRLPYHTAVERNRRQKSIINRTLLLLTVLSLSTIGYVAFRYIRL